MTTLNAVQVLFRKIASLKKAETVTRSLLSELSRAILSLHLLEGESQHNVGVVNRLLHSLSPTNKKMAKLFFRAFLPYQFNEETELFGKLLAKDAKRDTKYLAIASFLYEEGNDIWSWAEEHINMEAKPVNYGAKITNAVAIAMKEDKGGMKPSDVLQAVFAAGISVHDVIGILDSLTPKEQKAA